MTKAAKRVGNARARIFQIVHPSLGERICIRESDSTIHIVFNGDPFGSYSAAISSFVAGSGSSGISSGNLTENPVGSGQFSLDLSVGIVASNPAVGTNNRLIQVSDLNSGYGEIQPFAGIHCGSGSQDTGDGVVRRCPHCDPERPVPVSLVLEVGKSIEAGTCDKCARLGEPTLLTHANDVRYLCSWFSQPIDFCSGDHPAGTWMLEKADARTWKLSLRRGEHIVVHYEVATKAEKDCSFPLKLRRSGSGGTECKKWPMTVRIVPAP